MLSLKNRSLQTEILDRDDVPFEDIKQNMKELNSINSLLGGHAITVAGLKRIIGTKSNIFICEIGSGGGDNLHAIEQYCAEKNMKVHFIAIDIKQSCLQFCKEQYPEMKVDYVCSDYRKVIFEKKPGVIFSSLFCHHFNNNDLVLMLRWMEANCEEGFFINDLQRNGLAYYSIKWLTALFSRSYMVKHDAPLSVARGFKRREWQELLKSAGIFGATVQWKWAFRYLITYKKDNK